MTIICLRRLTFAMGRVESLLLIEVILPETNEYRDYRVTSLTFKNNDQHDAILNLVINSITKELFDNAVEPSRFSPFPASNSNET